MKDIHGFTKVALGKVSEMLKSRIKNGYASRAIDYK